MRILSAEINNFLSFRSNQSVEFEKGLNLFNGDIGSGKSSFYNAFYWCLYNKIYVTDEGWIKNPDEEKIINHSALKALKDNDSPAFMLDLARKDIGLALMAGASSKVPLSTGSVAREIYNIASAAGRGEDDWTTGIYRTLKSLSKLT